MKKLTLLSLLILLIFLVPFIQADTTFFDNQNDFFIMINHSFAQEGLSGTVPAGIIPTVDEPEIIVETKIKTEEAIVTIKEVVKKTWWAWLIICIFIYFGKRRRKKRKKEKRQALEKQEGL